MIPSMIPGAMRLGAVAVILACLTGVAGGAGLPPIVESTPLDEGEAALPPPAATRPPPATPQRASRPALPLEARVSRLERLVESQALVEILMRLDDLQRDIQDLRGMSEEQGHELAGLKQRQRELYLDVDRRLRELELKIPQGRAVPGAGAAQAGAGVSRPAAAAASVPALAQPAGPSAVVPTTPGPAGEGTAAADSAGADTDALAEQSAYQQAFNILKDGRYEEAIAAFQKFLVRYPKGQFADNAQYWLAEANYVMRRFPTAIEEFKKVLVNFPDSRKIPDAMLKIGFCYYELKEWKEARKILEELVRRFPDTTAAQLAKNRLHRMKLEGR